MRCEHCGQHDATCIGRSEPGERLKGACDSCCGHSHEDGYCVPIQPGDERGDAILRWVNDRRPAV